MSRDRMTRGQEQEPAKAAAPLAADIEFAGWKNLCDGIPGAWREDRRYRQQKEGALYYLGGESGQYMQITGGGKLTAGRYEQAHPGIENAVLVGRITQQYGSYEHAFIMASQLAGQRFVTDIFSEKPSVLEQIREARKNPAPPSPKAEVHRNASELEL